MCLFRFGDGSVYDHSSASNYIRKKRGRRYMGNGKKNENDIHSLLLSTFYIGASRQCLELVMSANSPSPLYLSLSGCI